MTAKHALRQLSDSIIGCKTEFIVDVGHPIIAQLDVQVKLHLAPQDKTAALRTAKTLLPLVLFSIRQRSPSDRRWCPRYVSASIVDPLTTSKPKTLAEPRPVAMSLSYNMYNIGMRDD